MPDVQTQQPRKGEVPKYKLIEKCYLNDRMYDPELMPLDQMADPLEDGTQPRKDLIVSFAGVPAYYMVPLNDAAKAMCAKHADRMQATNPIDELTIVAEPAKA